MDIGSILGNIGFDFRIFVFNTINFTILILLLKKFLFDKVMGIIDEREALINQGLSDSQKAQEDLEKAENKKKEILKGAKDRSNEILDEARMEATALLENAKLNAQTQSEYIISKAQNDSNTLKDKMLSTVKSNIAKIVTKELEDKIVK